MFHAILKYFPAVTPSCVFRTMVRQEKWSGIEVSIPLGFTAAVFMQKKKRGWKMTRSELEKNAGGFVVLHVHESDMIFSDCVCVLFQERKNKQRKMTVSQTMN